MLSFPLIVDCQLSIVDYTLHFKQLAGTSRGVYSERKVWYVHIASVSDPKRVGIGECAPLPLLSCDDVENYEGVLRGVCAQIVHDGVLDIERWRNFPSIIMGMETALLHYHSYGSYALWNTSFSRGEEGILINGLIWMGSHKSMLSQIEDKINQGYRCIKLKIGAIDFLEELSLLEHIRKHFSANDVELRVDANGAFSPEEVLAKLDALSVFDLHSIEQPIAAGNWGAMAELCRSSPLPIALDEELIGINGVADKGILLETIKPQYIILKPSLHGGFCGCEEWISAAKNRGINWWVTSALESNIGLNAIAQWCATLNNPLPQGLGTGQLFSNNIYMPLGIKGDCLWYG